MQVDERAGGPMLVLKRRTADAHEALEASLDLLAADLDRDRYAAVLVRFAAVYQPLEDEIGRALGHDAAALLDLAARRKVPALRTDLAALGAPVPPSSRVVPHLASEAAAVGALYVTEGATLGGALITAHVRAVLGPAAPTAFFSAYGRDVPARWSELRTALRVLLPTPEEVAAAADAAAAVFDAFAAELAA